MPDPEHKAEESVEDREAVSADDAVSKPEQHEQDLAAVRDWDEILVRDHTPKFTEQIVPTPGMQLKLIDEDMARSLAEYGKKIRSKSWKVQVGAFLFGAIFLGAIPAMLNFDIWPWFIAGAFFATMYASLLATRVSSAFNKRQYRAVSKLMNNALYWNQACAPLSVFPFLTLSRIQSRMLLVQGRYMEMEALLLISRATSENKIEWNGIPKSPLMANDLACTYIAQQRYEEALTLLKNLIFNNKNKQIRPYAILNLALCHVKMDHPEEAEKLLRENENVMKKAPKLLAVRFELVSALIDLKAGRLDEAERKLESSLEKARAISESDEFIAYCFQYLADVRFRQDRIDEADLYYKTAIDLYRGNDNPTYWSLAETMRAYAEMLNKLGRTAEEEKLLREAKLYESAYFERELMRLTYLRYRITEEKPVRLLTELVNVDGFPPLSIEVSPPGIEDEESTEDGAVEPV